MPTLQDELQNKVNKQPDSGTNQPRNQQNFLSDAETYRQNIVRAFGKNYVDLLLSNGAEKYNEYIDQVKKYVERNKKEITTSQLRNIFSRVKQLKQPEQAWRLRPQLAYTAGRNDQKGMKELVWLLDQLLANLGAADKERLENFKNFFEAIIAYHKFYGGK